MIADNTACIALAAIVLDEAEQISNEPCRENPGSSRTCERGTRCCIVRHLFREEHAARCKSLYLRLCEVAAKSKREAQ